MTDVSEDFKSEKTTMEEPDEIKPTESSTKEVREVKKNAKTYLAIISSDPLFPEASKVVHWRDPVKTGLLFGIFNFFFFLSTFAEYSLLTIFSYLLLTLLSICFGYSNYVVLKASWLQGKRVDNPFKERFKDATFHVSRQTAEQHLTTILDLVNLTIDNLREVFYCTDSLLSLRFALYFYLGATIGNWFSGPTLLYLGMLFSFVWFRLYEEKQKEIDQFYHIAQTQASGYLQLAVSKLPPAIGARFPQLKPKSN